MKYSPNSVWVNNFRFIKIKYHLLKNEEMEIYMKLSVFYEHIVEAAQQESKSISEICKMASSFGIEGVEIENKRLWENKEGVLSNLKEGNLEISCMYGFFDFSHSDDLKPGFEMVDLADELKIKKIMLIPGFLKDFEFLPIIYKQKVDKMIDMLQKICIYAKEKNIMVVLEDFDDKIAPFATAKQLTYFYENIPELYCAFDTGNFLYSEEHALEVLPMFIDNIGHVHCKDRSFAVKEGETPKATIKGRDMYSAAVGSGVIPMKEIVSQILKKGYDDYFAIEHFGSMNQLKDMELSANWFKENF